MPRPTISTPGSPELYPHRYRHNIARGTEVVLYDTQEEWFEKVDKILQGCFIYIDTSTVGSGKTFIVLKYAQKYNLPLFIVCPKTIVPMWYDVCNAHHIDIVEAMSYEALAGRSNSGVTHNWLTRVEAPVGHSVKDVKFYPSALFCELVKSGMMLVFDEFHKVKNENTYSKSIRALIRPVQYGGHSRVALISGTPFDKVPMVMTLLKTVGLLNFEPFIVKDGEALLYGAGELFELAKRLDRETFTELRTRIELNTSNFTEFIFQVYVKILRPILTGGMRLSPTVLGMFNTKNGFYNINEAYATGLEQQLENLRDLIETYGEEVENMPPEKNRSIFEALHLIEKSKTFDIARVAKTILYQNPWAKIVIAMNYQETTSIVKNAITARGIPSVVINGTVPANK